jgi:Phospholipase_D-nuclease N-terminal
VTFGPELVFIPFGLLFVGSFVVWIWALVDAIQVPDDSMYRSGTKLVWVLVVVLTQVVGAIIYFAIGRPPRRAAPTSAPPPAPPPPPPTPSSG